MYGDKGFFVRSHAKKQIVRLSKAARFFYKIVANCFKKTIRGPLLYAIIGGRFLAYPKMAKTGPFLRGPGAYGKGRKRMAQSLILASASPRRQELMACTGLPFQVITADAEEIQAGDPEALVMENARRKAKAVWEKHPDSVVLGADTVVYQDGAVLGKPRDQEDARAMLRRLSGAWHTVYTGVCVIVPGGKMDVRCDASRVHFVPLSDADIQRYIGSGEPMDKAGAYAVQGRAGMYVSRIEGSSSNVIGLPMHLVRDMLREAGFSI